MPGERIQHDISSDYFKDLIDLPDAKLIETPGLHGITQLSAVKVDKETDSEVGDFQFKIMFSPKKSIARLELYDPLIFAILMEQLLEGGYEVISSGEDVEFTKSDTGDGWAGHT